jgi:hypothetical protein
MRTSSLRTAALLALSLAVLTPLSRASAQDAAAESSAAESSAAESSAAESSAAESSAAESSAAESSAAESSAAETGAAAPDAGTTVHRPGFMERLRAQAQQPGNTQLLTSAISSIGFGPELLWGGGLELRLSHQPTGLPLRMGGFLQSEVLTDGAVRVAGGLQGGAWFMGCQVGLAYRFESDRYWSTLGVQLGKSIDFGIFSIGGRVVIPVAEFSFRDSQTATLTSTGVEGAIFMSVGLPTLLEGERPRGCGCRHGRGGEDAEDADATE